MGGVTSAPKLDVWFHFYVFLFCYNLKFYFIFCAIKH
jgi:hypothetical protein